MSTPAPSTYRHIRDGILCAAVLIAVAAVCAHPAHARAAQWKTVALPVHAAQGRIAFLDVDPGGYVWFGLRSDGTSSLGVLDPMGSFMFPLAASHPGAGTALAFEPVPEDAPGNGAMWIGCEDGLLLAERTGRVTSLESGSALVPPGTVRTIYCSGDGTKWIALAGSGVVCIDSAFNRASYSRSTGLAGNYINAIAEDPQGNLWFGSNSNGVSRLDRQGVWLQFTSAGSGLISDHVTHIAVEKQGRLWFVTPQGISVFDGAAWMSYTGRNSPLGSSSPTSLVIDRDGSKWIGTDGAGLLKLDSFSRWTSYTTSSSGLPDNRISALEIDEKGFLWLATPAGITRMEREAGGTASGSGFACPFGQALEWQSDGAASSEAEVAFALPSFPFGGRAWYYGAAWTGSDFMPDALDYELRAERSGATQLLFRGTFARITFFVHGALRAPEATSLQHTSASPFPAVLPAAVASCALPGTNIPSDDPAVVSLANELVRPESRVDMYAVLEDIVFSGFVQRLQLSPDSDAGASRVPEVLRTGSGDQVGRARLLCSLVRAAGLPARMVMGMDGSAWCQAWASRRGWISIASGFPVFDYTRSLRTGMPAGLSAREHAVAALSGRDDTTGLLSWHSTVSSTARFVPSDALRLPAHLRRASVLFVAVSDGESPPPEAKIPLDDDIFMHARQSGAVLELLFEDGAGGELHVLAPALDGSSTAVNVADRLLWRFAARRLGHMLVLENIECRVVSSELGVDSSE